MKINPDDIRLQCQGLCELLIAKNADYGSAVSEPNIFDSSANPLAGIEVRMSDKIRRLQNLKSKTGAIQSETVVDTMRDLAGYCILWCVIHNAREQGTI